MRNLALAAAGIAMALTLAGGAQQFLSPLQAAAALADGKPWTGRRPNGETMHLTLRPDGTGRFEGPVSREIAWIVQLETICLQIGFPIGSKCIRLSPRGQGYDAYEDDALAFTLSR
jgi:hypothetical protein